MFPDHGDNHHHLVVFQMRKTRETLLNDFRLSRFPSVIFPVKWSDKIKSSLDPFVLFTRKASYVQILSLLILEKKSIVQQCTLLGVAFTKLLLRATIVCFLFVHFLYLFLILSGSKGWNNAISQIIMTTRSSWTPTMLNIHMLI